MYRGRKGQVDGAGNPRQSAPARVLTLAVPLQTGVVLICAPQDSWHPRGRNTYCSPNPGLTRLIIP